MPAYAQDASLMDEMMNLRSQGLTDNLILAELTQRGYPPQQVQMALSSAASEGDNFASSPPYPQSGYSQPQQTPANPSDPQQGNIYERIEEIAESIIDQKWDELIVEVKKILEWKERIEQKQTQLQNDVAKLKEDFTLLHQGVLGKLEDYDTRMRDVGTELNAVGKVFKDVIPEFVENVKELSAITGKVKGKK